MADGIRDHLTDCFDGQLVIVLPCNPFNAGAEVDVLQHEVVGILARPILSPTPPVAQPVRLWYHHL